MKRCGRCQLWLDASAFSPNRARRDGLQSFCTPCQREYMRQHYTSNRDYYLAKAKRSNTKQKTWLREKLRELKDVPCADCGVRYPPYAMDFDHIRGEKRFNVSAAIRLNLDDLLTEVAKCEVVCSNCHRERTRRRAARP